MHETRRLTTSRILDTRVDAGGGGIAAVAEAARAVISEQRVCLVRGFPIDPDAYLTFLGTFGTPLPNYSSRSDLAKDDPNPQINRVRYKPKGQYVKHSVHYVGGDLPPHSARSWCTPRPRFFAMLMVDPGWRDAPEGQRGESVVLPWESMLAALAVRDGQAFTEHFERLTTTPLTFQANNVREELSDLPLCYRLGDATGPYDVGVRLKQDLQSKLGDLQEEIDGFDDYSKSVDYLVAGTRDPEFQCTLLMEAGDLLLLDNDRFAHGRRGIVGERAAGDGVEVNPRELWSVTVR